MSDKINLILEQQNIAGIILLESNKVTYANKVAQNLFSIGCADNLDFMTILDKQQQEKFELASQANADLRISDFVTKDDTSYDLLLERLSNAFCVLLVPAVSQEQILRSIGHVAGKYGHDLNNLLGSLRGVTDLIAHRLTKLPDISSQFEKQLQLMHTAINKAEQLTRQMRGYVRLEAPSKETVELGQVITGVIALLNASQKKPAEIFFATTEQFYVSANEFQLTQAFQSILSNAFDAVSRFKEKCLTIDIKEVTEKAAIDTKSKMVEVVLIDHGKGLSADSLKKALKALHSDKAGGIGTGLGLGLPMARQIIEDHSGQFEIRSKEGAGTTVVVRLPIVAAS